MKLCFKNLETFISVHNKTLNNKKFMNEFRKTFTTTSNEILLNNSSLLTSKNNIEKSVPQKTVLYMWISSIILGRKKSDYSSRFNFSHTPTQLNFFNDKNPKQVFTGTRHHGVITEDGNLYTFGDAYKGVLGHGNDLKISYRTPKLVQYFAKNKIKVKKIFFGDAHSLALSEDGDLYSWGYGGKLRGIFSFYKGKTLFRYKKYFICKKIFLDYFSIKFDFI